jgi:hypothetical protein
MEGDSELTATIASIARKRRLLRGATGNARLSLAAKGRQNGVNVPHPGAARNRSRKPIETASPSFKAALARCRSIVTTALKAKPAGGG